MKIFATLALAESELDLQKQTPAGCSLVCSRSLPDPESRHREFLAADICFGNPPVEWLEQATRLRWLQLESVGSEAYLAAPAADWKQRIKLTNLSGFFGQPVAETLVAGVLALRRGLPALCHAQQRAQWRREQVRPQLRLMQGSQAIILGAGSIGSALGRILAGFDVRCTYFARTSRQAGLHTPAELDARLPAADFVFGCLPDNPASRGLLNRDRLARFKPGAILANGGRGSLIDEPAVLEALDHGPLGGAVLDVTQVEPLPPHHPFWSHPRVLLTQHTAGGFEHEVRGKTDFFLENLLRLQRGEPLLNPVLFP